MSNELDLTHKILVSLFFLNLLIAGFSIVATSAIGINNPAIAKLEGLNQLVNSSSNNLVNSFNVTLLNPIYNNSGEVDLSISWVIPNALLFIVNLLWKIIYFVVNLIVLLGIGLYFVIEVLFGIVPQMLNADFGCVNPAIADFGCSVAFIMSSVFKIVGILLSVYAFYLITKLIGRVWGGGSG